MIIKKPSILIVDDSQENLDILVELLGNTYDITATINSKIAVDLYVEESPDLVLLDILMPDIDGYEVCKKIKKYEQSINTPVIFITGISDSIKKRKGFECGAVDFITKPFDTCEVSARIDTHIKLKRYQEDLKNKNESLLKMVDEKTKKLKHMMRKLEKSTVATILILSRASEYRDDDTGNHVVRVGHISALLASKLELDEALVENLLLAAPMHDIGKIGIPDNILLKPGKLEYSEFELIKTHTIIGAKILEESNEPILKLAEKIAITHHEKWDGTGYPYSLKGEEIPIESRIVAIADVFDAITSERIYKSAMPFEDAVEIIKNGAGNHFDNNVVDVFLSSLDEIKDIFKNFKDSKYKSISKNIFELKSK